MSSVHRRVGRALVLMLLLGASAPGQPPATRPTTTATAPDQQRLNDFITLIEGPDLPPAARRTGARELLRQGWPQTAERLAAILAGDDLAAKVAIALALADLPELVEEAYVDPLMAMLADPSAEARHAAAMALAGCRDSGVIPRLRAIVLDEEKPVPLRLAAIGALSTMSKRSAVAALVEAIDDPNATISQPALEALERTTAMSFGGDAAQARAWWERSQEIPLPEWQQDRIDRLAQRTRELGRQLRELERRLVDSFREGYIRTPEPERSALLQSYLKDESALVRLLGLELVQRQLGEGKALPVEIAAQVRAQLRDLLTDSEPDVRAAAVQAVARFRDPADAGRFVSLLATERRVTVRRALVNGLGYVGDAAVTPPLLAILQAPDNPCLTEAVAAVGRLAERGVLAAEVRADAADELLKTFGRTQPTDVVLRERVLWAMSLVADPRFGDAFMTALAENEAAVVRQTAARGIAALKHPQTAYVLVPLTRDGDPTIRKTAVAALAELAATDAHLRVLWERLGPQETDASIRQSAWQAALRILSGRSVAEVERWIARLPDDGDERDRRTRELLEAMEASLAKVPEALAELGGVWLRIAGQRVAVGKTDAALAAYTAALRVVRAAQAPEVPAVALELLRFALVNERYDAAVAATLANGNPPLDGPALWGGFKGEIEARLTKQKAAQASAMLEALRAHPPAAFPPEVAQEIEALLARA